MIISICIPTLLRPVMLGRLLGSLVALDTGGAAVHVVVVDNDPSGSAEPTVRRFESLIPNLVYQVEPRRGLATARNRLVAIAASLGSDYLIFVDDDEWVEPSWLLSFVGLAAAGRADVLRGPVYAEYDEGTPPWIIASKFFDPPEYPTGTPIRIARYRQHNDPARLALQVRRALRPEVRPHGRGGHSFLRADPPARCSLRLVRRGDRPRAGPVEPVQGRMDHQACLPESASHIRNASSCSTGLFTAAFSGRPGPSPGSGRACSSWSLPSSSVGSPWSARSGSARGRGRDPGDHELPVFRI